MTFLDPALLSLLLLAPVLVLLYVLAQRRRRTYAIRFTNLALLASVAGRRPNVRRHIPSFLFLLGLAGLVIASAGPVLNLEVARQRADVMLVIDVSGSMEATDVLPSRIEAARSAARTLINSLPGSDRIGLVSFNNRATLVAPLTEEHGSVSRALGTLRPGGGTAIGDAIVAAVAQFQPGSTASSSRRVPGLIVLLTDGASNAGIDPATAAGSAQRAAIKIDTIGIGRRGQPTFVRGQPVDGVDETSLQSLASVTGGSYFYAEAAGQLDRIYSSLGSSFAWQFVRIDLAPFVFVLAALGLLAGGLLSLRWFRLFP